MRLLTDPAFLAATLGDIYDCILDPARWQAVIPELAAMIGARRAAMGIANAAGTSAAGGMPSIAVMHGYPSLERVAEYGPLNPVLPLALVHPMDRAFVASRVLGLPALQATRFYREYLKPLGDSDIIGFVVTREGSAFGNWLLVTQDDRPPITEEEAAGFELIAPHIRRAVEISQVFGAQRVASDTYRGALDALDSAVLIIDGERRVTYANARAGSALDAGDVLRLRDGRLRGATEAAERVLRRLTEEAVAGGAAGFEAIVPGMDGEERLLFSVALDGETRLDQADRAIMLVLRAPREDTRNPIAIATRLFNLTPAQVQVLAFLAQGHTPDAIADILGVSTTTVRTHLSDLFGKTGTSRQAELVARTLSLASPLRQAGPPGSAPTAGA